MSIKNKAKVWAQICNSKAVYIFFTFYPQVLEYYYVLGLTEEYQVHIRIEILEVYYFCHFQYQKQFLNPVKY